MIYAENTKNVEFKNPHPELPVREPILKLGKMITDRAAIKLGLEIGRASCRERV